MKIKTNIQSAFLGMAVVSALTFACKPDVTLESDVETLDNFAAGSALRANSCEGDASSDAVSMRNSGAYNSRIVFPVEYTKDDELDFFKTLNAVPGGIHATFFGLGGEIHLNAHANFICRDVLAKSGYPQQSNADGSVLGCWYISEKNAPVIVLDPHKDAVRHSLVRQFGYVTSELLVRYELKEVTEDIQTDDMGTMSWKAEYKNKLSSEDAQFITNLAQSFVNEASDAGYDLMPYVNSQTNQFYDGFNSWVLAEAFDSYFCSKETKKAMKKSFPKTYDLFDDDFNDMFRSGWNTVENNSSYFYEPFAEVVGGLTLVGSYPPPMISTNGRYPRAYVQNGQDPHQGVGPNQSVVQSPVQNQRGKYSGKGRVSPPPVQTGKGKGGATQQDPGQNKVGQTPQTPARGDVKGGKHPTSVQQPVATTKGGNTGLPSVVSGPKDPGQHPGQNKDDDDSSFGGKGFLRNVGIALSQGLLAQVGVYTGHRAGGPVMNGNPRVSANVGINGNAGYRDSDDPYAVSASDDSVRTSAVDDEREERLDSDRTESAWNSSSWESSNASVTPPTKTAKAAVPKAKKRKSACGSIGAGAPGLGGYLLIMMMGLVPMFVRRKD